MPLSLPDLVCLGIVIVHCPSLSAETQMSKFELLCHHICAIIAPRLSARSILHAKRDLNVHIFFRFQEMRPFQTG